MSKERSVSERSGDRPAVDLAHLCAMHPRLPGEMAAIMVLRAGLGLQRNKHSSGVCLEVGIEDVKHPWTLAWPAVDMGTAKQHDQNQITEDGAEAVALAVAHNARGWRVVRRMQREEHADWLLEHQHEGKRRLVAFEVSGVDRGAIIVRMREKLAQVAKSCDVDHRWAGVVGFQSPETALRLVKERTYGR